MQELILGSSSKYRKDILKRIILDFKTIKPKVDETIIINESPKKMALRLALEKALKVAEKFPKAIVIGCDQTATTQKKILQKPENFDNALKQLQFLKGKKVKFYSAFCVLNLLKKKIYLECDEFSASYRNFNDSEINKYLKKEKPYNCVGSIKSEALGITMLAEIKSNDPTSIIGLPLIKLSKILRNEGLL